MYICYWKFVQGGLHQISWFQFLPHEPDLNPLPDKRLDLIYFLLFSFFLVYCFNITEVTFCSNSVKVDQKDAAMLLVLSSHLQLQKEGFLSAWTNSFVGPWDPSQGLHNPGRDCHGFVIICNFYFVSYKKERMKWLSNFYVPKFLISVLNMQMKRLNCGFSFLGVIHQLLRLLSQHYPD